MDSERLEQLWSMSHSFWMLNDNPNASGFRSIRDLNPISTETCEEG